jgi:Helix-turn-helix domain
VSTRKRGSDWVGRPAMRSPGRPTVGRRERRQRFWAAVACGRSSEDAAVEAGVSSAVGVRWFREGGGMPSVTLAPLSGRYLSFVEREEIALLRAGGCGVREIARRLGRSPSTISRELRRNAATRSGGLEYRASTAQWHADRRGRRPKPAKLAVNAELRRYLVFKVSVERPASKSGETSGAALPQRGRRPQADLPRESRTRCRDGPGRGPARKPCSRSGPLRQSVPVSRSIDERCGERRRRVRCETHVRERLAVLVCSPARDVVMAQVVTAHALGVSGEGEA